MHARQHCCSAAQETTIALQTSSDLVCVAAQVEIGLLSRGEDTDLVPVGVRFGVDGDWIWAFADPPTSLTTAAEGSVAPKAPSDPGRGRKVVAPPGAVLHAASPQESGGDVLRATLCALVATKSMGTLRRIPFASGQLMPLAEACVEGIESRSTGGEAAAALALALAEVCSRVRAAGLGRSGSGSGLFSLVLM